MSLPASYGWAKDRHYPALYVLDGETDFAHTVSSARFLASRGEIPEMIIVGITSTIRVRDYTQTDWAEAWVGGGGAERFREFLSTELIPAIDESHRTNGYQILSGHSAGGQFVLYCLTSEPDLFDAYVALAPSLDWDHNLPQRSLHEAFERTEQLPAFLYVARADDFGRPLHDFEDLVATLVTTSPAGFRWTSRAFPDETHASLPLLGQIDALRSLFFQYRYHDRQDSTLEDADEHFRRVSGIVGYTIDVPERVINAFGYEALSRNEIEDAIALFERNVKANPYSANARDSLADGYGKAGRWNDAVDAERRAVELATEFDDPNLPYFTRQLETMRERELEK